MKDVSSLSLSELVTEIQTVRKSIRADSRRVYELSRLLQDKVRKKDVDAFTARYIAFTNASIRFAGSVDQSVQRTSTFDRVVNTIEQEKTDAEREKKTERDKRKHVATPPSTQPGMSDLVSLFGQEMIDATR